VKQIIADVDSGKLSTGAGIPEVPEIDFSQFGEIELQKMSKIAKVTSANMTRNWLNVPHVTQFDDADITELEAFRKSMKAEAEKRGVRLTPLPFLLKAAAAALAEEPSFNVSLHADGQHIVQKKYIHIGVAVDTPNGLMVPVIRDVDKKGLWELAAESVEVAAKARNGKLMPRDMQGGCFTISSLGAIGGNGFTPIVNAPEVAIMGVSKAQIKPVWNGSEFEPRQMLPLSVSYDHRAINGADCGRFFNYMVSMLGDIRKLLL
jgi:pyruvate dehydrogenase E2 component (dihydrolipoamide acetyltransferase)